SALALALLLACLALTGCVKKDVIASQLADPVTRNEDLETSMTIMDAHPEYLPDVYAAAKRHPRTLEAMLALATADLNDPAMAARVAAQVANHPEVVERIVRESLDAASKSPRARAAIDRAIGERADESAEIVADEPLVMAALVKAAVEVIEKRPAARAAVLRAMRESSGRIVSLTMADPETMKAFVAAAVREATAHHGTAKLALEALGCP
ncbi:MAG: hypothetical protein ACRELB_20440, partial [Polyangiaceae bacterium]